MCQIKVNMKWVDESNMWHMTNHETGKHIQEYYDCPTIGRVMPNLDKKQINVFLVDIIFCGYINGVNKEATNG